MGNGYILVTGGSKGIGAAIALELSRSGYDIILHYNKSSASAGSVAEECRRNGSNVALIGADLTSSNGIKDLCNRVRKLNLKLKGIVNNAGYGAGDDINRVTEEALDAVLTINTKAPLLIIKNLLDLLEENASIVNMSSSASMRPIASSISYSASKAALSNITKSLALNFGPRIRINAVAPGFIETDMTVFFRQNEKIYDSIIKRTPLKRFGKPEEIAKIARFLISDDSSFMTGEVIVADGGITI
ncbi:MAG: SDR family oxidoreductase [Candidatus Thermoplasmatota archaeon]|nr:SDR family oxidoreductase [Candidatus Thermoplasmatota archaeon]